jgi:hypothetical protein
MTAARHDTRATWSGTSWSGSAPFSRAAGLRVAGVGVASLGLSGSAEVAVDLQGTAVHPDAPDDAWESLWTATLTPAAPATAQLARPVWVGVAAWLRWVLSNVSAPAPGASIHAALSGEAE